ncbi:hypothetical protein AN9264.2 [Aspergillus nidulans FGSC A4]|uniref:Carboxylic ester hydrolase n=1 Tax=Emericella nidulans (strain FGSC A4 / ATCC 38163 / CBS 112.46 / NRRL 194 / M139) TaxID=227321 RepID=Q5AR16_EMENI|nr:hypothetical protein [Aspergillus nidulans FGSC A4]EAA66331.1 hypothetical protein AN9264.2 [Aspergillus nidulans FGSC A4]CBF87284.1 TPA: conserved hypothetical protein [Aspergillus nidulans FGSC A4]|eukprot:XP_682533.1 hypothetical protein AN9264.2 [Aspergillus nidulans FGSC A4]
MVSFCIQNVFIFLDTALFADTWTSSLYSLSALLIGAATALECSPASIRSPTFRNGRFQSLDSGDYSTGLEPIYLAYAVAQGFVSAFTDGGVPSDAGATTTIATDLSATNDMAEIGKQVTAYYNRPAEYTYFSGCSGGGREGHAMAQQFSDAFDGILALSPAITIESLIPASYWPTQITNENQIYPSPCEIDAFVSAAVKHCD